LLTNRYLATIREKKQLAFASDTVQQTLEHMTVFDPTFKLPGGLFLTDGEKLKAHPDGMDKLTWKVSSRSVPVEE
jgi:hypothetical protein